MDVDVRATSDDLVGLAAQGRRWEERGCDGIFTAETAHNPFLPLVAVANATRRISVGTSIAVAFARSPMDMAHLARDMQDLSGGRFVLGLGSQVRAHITRRFSMPWGRPAARMREYIMALHAIWACWETGSPERFEGDFYTHTLMPPFFSPGPSEHPRPPILLAAVGERMTRVAAEVADGLLVHPFSTHAYLSGCTLPLVTSVLGDCGRDRADFQVSHSVSVVTGRTDRDLHEAQEAMRRQLAFYGSTPAYRGVLEHHGLEDVADRLHELSRTADGNPRHGIEDLVTDEVMGLFAVTGSPEAAGAELWERYGPLLDRMNLYTPYAMDDSVLADAVQAVLRARSAAAPDVGPIAST